MGYGGSAAAITQLAGTALKAYGQYQSGQGALLTGQQQQTQQDYEASQLRMQAGQVTAAGTQAANIQGQQTAFQLSNLKAAAAARGGSATSPTVLNLAGQTGARGNYNSLSDLFSANEKAAGLNTQAGLDIWSGSNDLTAGQMKETAENEAALETSLSGVSTFASKYGGGGAGGGGGTAPPDYGAGGLTNTSAGNLI